MELETLIILFGQLFLQGLKLSQEFWISGLSLFSTRLFSDLVYFEVFLEHLEDLVTFSDLVSLEAVLQILRSFSTVSTRLKIQEESYCLNLFVCVSLRT